jgi:hypothetical protein
VSTLRVDSIQNRTGGDLITAKGMARAWVNFNGTGTVSIRSAHNVSSITDNGTGNYTINFASAMADTNYATILTTSRFTSAGGSMIGIHQASTYSDDPTGVTTLTGSVRVNVGSGSGGVDQAVITAAIFD